MINLVLSFILPVLFMAVALIVLGVKKFVERTGELVAEDLHEKRKG